MKRAMYVRLGETELALDWLEKAYEERMSTGAIALQTRGRHVATYNGATQSTRARGNAEARFECEAAMAAMRARGRLFLVGCLVLEATLSIPEPAFARTQSTSSAAQVFSATLLKNGRIRLAGESLERVAGATLQGDGLALDQSLGIAVPAGAVPPLGSVDLWAKSLIALVPGRAYTIALDTLDGPLTTSLLIVANGRDVLTPTVLDVNNFREASDPDDTEAFRRAAEMARGLRGHTIIYVPAKRPPSDRDTSGRGFYHVSGSISLGPEARVLSHGHAIIIQDCARCVTFNVPAAADVRIEGIAFKGGFTHLVVRARPGVDADVLVDRCEFQSSNGPAIVATGDRSQRQRRSLFIDRSRFTWPRQALETSFDQTWVRDSSLHAVDDTAFFVNKAGTLVLDNVLGNPEFGDGSAAHPRLTDARWVDNYGSFYAVAARFGGEFAGGPILRHYARLDRSTEPQTVAVLHSQVSAGGLFPEAAVITLADGTVPQRLWLVGTYFLAGSPFVRGAPLDQTLVDQMDLVIEGYMAACANRAKCNPGTYTEQAIPNAMLAVLQQDTAREFEQPITIRPPNVRSPTPIDWGNGVVNVKQYRKSEDVDDTAAIKRAVQEARWFALPFETRDQLFGAMPLYFPPGNYQISEAIVLPYVAHVFGEGMPTITQTSHTTPIFKADAIDPYTRVASFSGLRLVGGSSQILFSNCNAPGSELIVDRMEFERAGRVSVEAYAPAVCNGLGYNDGHLSTNLVVSESAFMRNAAVMRNVGDKASLRNSVVRDCPTCRVPDTPVIENVYGGLTIQLSVFVGGDVSGASSRWISNNGYLVVDASRFEGEGMSLVAEVMRPLRGWFYDSPDGLILYEALVPAEDVDPFMSTVVAMDQIEVSSTASPDGVLLLDGHVPGLFRLVGARGVSADTTVRVAPGFDLASDLELRKIGFSLARIGNPCRFTFSDRLTVGTLPTELQDFLTYSRLNMPHWNPF